MIFKEDIIQKLKLDFKDSSDNAVEILNNAFNKADYIETERIIRCIIFLAGGNLDKLKKFIDYAIIDPRDVILLAEYENHDNKEVKVKRVRDFNKTFEKCNENVTE